MPSARLRLALLVAAFALLAVVVLWPAPAEAQCGTQASSCKNCHEVQGEYPVSAEGAWHTDHAFGDFCEFCHAGNVTAADEDAAHEGLIYPMSDPAGSCSSCHPTDYQELAVGYASTLGIELTAPDESGGSDAGSDTPSGGAETPAEEAVEDTTPTEETASGAVFDLNLRYDEAQPRQVTAPNAGDVILTLMLVGLIAAFGVLIWRFEGLGQKWAELRGKSPQPAYASAGAGAVPAAAPTSPQLESLLARLERTSPATIAALNRLLQDNPNRGSQMIEALAHIDPRLVEVVGRLDERDLDMLVALVRELKARGG